MASKVGRLIQDQNLGHSDGACVVGKTTNKGARGGRIPLGDVSNMGKLQSTKASKKAAPTNFPEINSATSSKKGLSNGKSNNTVKPLQKTSSIVAKDSCFDFEEEGFLHDHKKCIEAMREAAEMDQMEVFRMIHGPNPSRISSPSKDYQLTKLEEESLAIYLEDESSLLHFKYVASPRSSPPLSPDRFTDFPRIWEDCDFQVIGSP